MKNLAESDCKDNALLLAHGDLDVRALGKMEQYLLLVARGFAVSAHVSDRSLAIASQAGPTSDAHHSRVQRGFRVVNHDI